METTQVRRVLVAYTTNSGTTVDAAQAVADGLAGEGTQVDVCRLEAVSDLAPYAAVVIGGPMMMGWHKAAVAFAKKHQQALSRVPVAYFFTARSLTRTGETAVDAVPISVDPVLAKPPKQANALSFRERYATATNYVRPVLKAAPGVRPVSVALFGGKLELTRLKLWQTLFVLLVIGAQPGGYFNGPFIRDWAAGLRAALLSGAPLAA